MCKICPQCGAIAEFNAYYGRVTCTRCNWESEESKLTAQSKKENKMKNQFIIEFTYYEKGKIRTTYAGYILSLPSPFRSFDQAKRFKTIDDARGWLTDILKDIEHNPDFAFSRRKIESVQFLCIQVFAAEDITEKYISNSERFLEKNYQLR